MCFTSSAPSIPRSVLPDDPLLWRFIEWVLRASPREGLRVFASGQRPPHAALSTDKVLAYLQSVSGAAANALLDLVRAHETSWGSL